MSIKILFDAFKYLLSAANIEQPKVKAVMIVENNTGDAELLSMVCVQHGYIPHVFLTLNLALVGLKDRLWHRVLVDFHLGNSITDGLVFARQAKEALPRINLVFVTAHAGDLEGHDEMIEFPLVLKGHNPVRFDRAIASVLASDDRPQELKRWKLFLLCGLLCFASCMIGALAERMDWFPPITGVGP
jgi:two-component SAPR family response regulator